MKRILEKKGIPHINFKQDTFLKQLLLFGVSAALSLFCVLYHERRTEEQHS